MTFREQLRLYLRARHPLLLVPTAEERRAEHEIVAAARAEEAQVQVWTMTRGWHEPGTFGVRGAEGVADPLTSLREIADLPERTVCVVKDLHPCFAQPDVVRVLRDLVPFLKAGAGRTLILVSPQLNLPPELTREVTLCPLVLPTRAELDAVLARILKSSPSPSSSTAHSARRP
jgi:hypothetical protein